MQVGRHIIQITEFDDQWLVEVISRGVPMLDIPFKKSKHPPSVALDRAIKLKAALAFGDDRPDYLFLAVTKEQGVLDLNNDAEMILFKLACT